MSEVVNTNDDFGHNVYMPSKKYTLFDLSTKLNGHVNSSECIVVIEINIRKVDFEELDKTTMLYTSKIRCIESHSTIRDAAGSILCYIRSRENPLDNLRIYDRLIATPFEIAYVFKTNEELSRVYDEVSRQLNEPSFNLDDVDQEELEAMRELKNNLTNSALSDVYYGIVYDKLKGYSLNNLNTPWRIEQKVHSNPKKLHKVEFYRDDGILHARVCVKANEYVYIESSTQSSGTLGKRYRAYGY